MGHYWTEVTVRGVVIDPLTGDPAILLEDNAETTIIPVPADPGGAESIICELEGIRRDASHSLLYRFFIRHGIRLNRLEIGRGGDGQLATVLCYRHDGNSFRMDARPADGIALAIQSGAPMFASVALVHDLRSTVRSPRVQDNSDLLILSAHARKRPPVT